MPHSSLALAVVFVGGEEPMLVVLVMLLSPANPACAIFLLWCIYKIFSILE
jgi:hypothetical protein